MTANQADKSLTDALAMISITHGPSNIVGKRDWFDCRGNQLGSFDAHEGWQEFKTIIAARLNLSAQVAS